MSYLTPIRSCYSPGMNEKPNAPIVTRDANHMAYPDGVEIFIGLCLTKEQAKIAEAEGFFDAEMTVAQAYRRFHAVLRAVESRSGGFKSTYLIKLQSEDAFPRLRRCRPKL
jgi:hypothetical protein